MNIILQNPAKVESVPSATEFNAWLQAVALELPEALKDFTELTIRIVDKTESAMLNKTYRNKEGSTNILSFQYDMLAEEIERNLGDLVICAELVQLEAKAQDKTEMAHWAHLTIHGILHLLSYDHVKSDEADCMEALEIKILAKLNLANPYE